MDGSRSAPQPLFVAPQELTVDLRSGYCVNLRNDNLDQILREMPVGVSGRYAIGARSISPAYDIAKRILDPGIGLTRIALGELTPFLICVAAALKKPEETLNENQELLENRNVRLVDGSFRGYSGEEEIACVSKDVLLRAYSLLKRHYAPLPSIHVDMSLSEQALHSNLHDQFREFFDALKVRGDRLRFIYVLPKNRIPYLLLRRNERGLYEIPTCPSSLDHGRVDGFLEGLKTEFGDFDTSGNFFMNTFNSPAAITVANPSIDAASLSYRARTRRDDYIFVRAVNLFQVGYELLHGRRAITNSPYARVISDGRLFVTVGTSTRGEQLEQIQTRAGNYPIDPSVMAAMDLFSGLRGWMYRVGEFDCDEHAAHWLRPTAHWTLITPPTTAAAAASVGAFAPVALSQAQINTILEIYQSNRDRMPDFPDPQRPGNDFKNIEKGMAIAISQVAPSSQNGCLTAFRLVFSAERADALLESIISGDDD